MAERLVIVLSLLNGALGFLCSTLDIGTDISRIGDIVSGGVVQPGWTYQDASYKSSPPESNLYFYVRGLEYLGPEFRVTAFHHEDEAKPDEMKWLFMNVTLDESLSGFFNEYNVFKVEQKCLDKEGGTTLRLNVTFTAPTCDPVTVNWMKVCGEPTIKREGLMIGLSGASNELVVDGDTTPAFDGNTKVDSYTISSDEDFSTVYLYMTDVYARTYFRSPYMITDHEVMYPTLNGTAAAGGWIEKEPKVLQITYNCLVSDGKKEEVILVVELPYFHDLEIHFFKRCGSKKAPKKSNYLGFAKVGLFFGVGGLIVYMINQYRQGETGWKMLPMGEAMAEVFENLKSKIRSRQPYHQPLDKELPDFDDDGRTGFNVHSQYGTL